jgi:hypothetical protein
LFWTGVGFLSASLGFLTYRSLCESSYSFSGSYSSQRPSPCHPCPRSTRRPRTNTCALKTSTLSCVIVPTCRALLTPVWYLFRGLQGQGYGPVREVNSRGHVDLDFTTDGGDGDAATAGTWDTIRACLLVPRLSVPVWKNNKLHFRQASVRDQY